MPIKTLNTRNDVMENGLTKDEKKSFYKRFATLDLGIARILNILEADDKIGEKGLVKTVHLMEKTLAELLMREKVYKAKGTVWGMVGGALLTFLIFLGKFLITKFIV